MYIYILKEGLRLSRFASNFRFKLPWFAEFSRKVSQGAVSICGPDTSFQYERVPNKRFRLNLKNHSIQNLQSHDCRIFYVLRSSVASCYWCSKNLLSHWVKWESFHFESSWTTGISGTGTAGTRPEFSLRWRGAVNPGMIEREAKFGDVPSPVGLGCFL